MGEKRIDWGEWVRWAAGILIAAVAVFLGLQTKTEILSSRVDRHDTQICTLENKYDDISEIKTDIKWIKSALMERRK